MRMRLAQALLLGMALAGPAAAVPLVGGLGGPAGYGELAMGRNDDGSSSRLNLPFAINFFGSTYNNFWINNNGNVTFRSALGAFTPNPFPVTAQPMIAPYWADVDTRCAACGAVYVAAPNAGTVVATWNNVGYFSSSADKTNDFQLVLSNRAETGAGNFDIQFRYNRLEWTTGGASGGSGGLGGTPAQAGYDAGNGVNFFTLPGSRTAAVLDLANTSNVATDTPGLWQFQIRNGAITDGSSPAAPLLPTIVRPDGAFVFDFNIQIGRTIFIDPVVAVGYDYEVESGPNIASVVLPAIPGDTDGYQIFGFNGLTGLYDILLGSVMPGELYTFAAGGVSRFAVRDIDGGLDPSDPLAFVTGLTFVSDGTVRMVQRPFTVDTGGSGGGPVPVPEPSTLALLLAGLAGVGALRRRRRG